MKSSAGTKERIRGILWKVLVLGVFLGIWEGSIKAIKRNKGKTF